jgi:hypothetical protein
MSTPEQRYAAIVEALKSEPGVIHSTGKGFGSGGLKAKDKMFACLTPDQALLLKLPAARVKALVAAGEGRPFEPRPGRVMKEWVLVRPDAGADWLGLAREAMDFVR